MLFWCHGLHQDTFYLIKAREYNLHPGIHGSARIGRQYSEFYGRTNGSLYELRLQDRCRSWVEITLNDTSCDVAISCYNTTTPLQLELLHQDTWQQRNTKLLEYGLYAIWIALLGSFLQYQAMSELRAEKIHPWVFQSLLIADVSLFLSLLNLESYYLNTQATMLFFLGLHLFFLTRLLQYMDRPWFSAIFYGAVVFLFSQIHIMVGVVLSVLLIAMLSRQVVFSFQHGVTPGLVNAFLLSLLARCFVPLYAWTCPVNLINLGQHHYEGVYVTVLMAIVLLILLVQSVQPRFFLDAIPLLHAYMDLKPVHQYVAPEEALESACGICLLDFEETDRILQAPCEHIFHEACLKEWLMIKLQCPTCRQALPPI